jgi:hypothetical protein|tara:strand:- start:966 stop:1460 length:495 start_codon:yes stop_codon:yes gene_type:complete
MAQNQPSKAIAVIPSDTINIPVPGIITSGTNTGGATTLTDAGQDFTNATTNANGYNISGGDVVISAAGVISEIASVDSATQLTLLTAIAAGTYDIYKGNYQILGESEGFTLFVGTGGPATVLRIQTLTGQDVSLLNIPDSSFIPIQVQRVWATTTTCSNIIALQ